MNSRLKLLHVRTDNKAFFDATVEAYDIPEFENSYLINAAKEDHAYWAAKGQNVRAVASDDLLRVAASIEHDILIVHYLSGRSAQVMRQSADGRRLIVWSSWGCDYQDFIGNFDHVIHLPQTRKILNTCRSKSVKGRMRQFAIALSAKVRHRLIRQALPSMDVITHVHEDFERMRQMYPGVRAFSHQVGYYTVGVSFQAESVRRGADIQVGNAADPCMNHAECFEALRRVWNGESQILCPLSYGDMCYGDRVEALGHEMFGDRFMPLRKYMPMKDFNEIVGNCGSVFLNSIRQKAIGNISLALYQGRAVFLNARNPLHQTFGALGAKVFSIEDAIAHGSEPQRLLTDEQREINQRVIGAYCSRDAIQDRARFLGRLYFDKRAQRGADTGKVVLPTQPVA